MNPNPIPSLPFDWFSEPGDTRTALDVCKSIYEEQETRRAAIIASRAAKIPPLDEEAAKTYRDRRRKRLLELMQSTGSGMYYTICAVQPTVHSTSHAVDDDAPSPAAGRVDTPRPKKPFKRPSPMASQEEGLGPKRKRDRPVKRLFGPSAAGSTIGYATYIPEYNPSLFQLLTTATVLQISKLRSQAKEKILMRRQACRCLPMMMTKSIRRTKRPQNSNEHLACDIM